MRVKKSLWPQIEATFKQMDIAATELECFKALQKQEQLAASHRIHNIWAEVQKQKELEKTLQNRYGSLIEELEKVQNIMDRCRLQAQQQEEIEANNHSPESTETTETKTDKTDVRGTENCEVVSHSEEDGNALAVAVESSRDGTADQPVGDILQDQATSSPSYDMDVDPHKMQTIHDTNVNFTNASPAAENVAQKIDGTSTIEGNAENGDSMPEMGGIVETSSLNHGAFADTVNPRDSSLKESNAVREETN